MVVVATDSGMTVIVRAGGGRDALVLFPSAFPHAFLGFVLEAAEGCHLDARLVEWLAGGRCRFLRRNLAFCFFSTLTWCTRSSRREAARIVWAGLTLMAIDLIWLWFHARKIRSPCWWALLSK